MNGKYSNKVNTSRNQIRIKKLLENLGHTNVEVWWEPVSGGYEMAGPDGGVFFTSDQYDYINPIGYSFVEAEEYVTEEYIVRNDSERSLEELQEEQFLLNKCKQVCENSKYGIGIIS